MAKVQVGLTIDEELRDWADGRVNMSKMLNDSLIRAREVDSMAVGLVYTKQDATARMDKALQAVANEYRNGDTLEARINARYVARKQAEIMGDMWPGTSFKWTDLFTRGRALAKLPLLPLENENTEKK